MECEGNCLQNLQSTRCKPPSTLRHLLAKHSPDRRRPLFVRPHLLRALRPRSQHHHPSRLYRRHRPHLCPIYTRDRLNNLSNRIKCGVTVRGMSVADYLSAARNSLQPCQKQILYLSLAKERVAAERQTKQRTNVSFIKDKFIHHRGQNRPYLRTKLLFSIINNTFRPLTNQIRAYENWALLVSKATTSKCLKPRSMMIHPLLMRLPGKTASTFRHQEKKTEQKNCTYWRQERKSFGNFRFNTTFASAKRIIVLC